MSKDRSPRESCWMTTGTRGMCNLQVAVSRHGSLRATNQLQEPPMPVVNREIVLPVPRERAWELVTEPEELETWLAEEVEFEPREGAPVRTAEGGEVREGMVERVEDERGIV